MIKTLLVYDGKMSSAERIAERLSYLIGNAKVCEISEYPEDLTVYEGYCFVFNFYGAVTAAKETGFLQAHYKEMSGRRIAMVGIGFSDLGFMNYIVNLEKTTGLTGIEGYFLTKESETDRIGGEIGSLMRKPEHPMEKEKLASEIDAFVKEHNTLALATATEDYLRNTPLEYLYLNGLFYIITEGGNKFRGILDNGRFCAVIFDSYTEMGNTRGLQITGEAKIVPIGSSEYLEVMAARKITEEQLKSLPITMFIVKLIPMKYEMLNSAFKKDGYDVHQSMRTAFQEKHWEAGAIFAQASAAKEADERSSMDAEKKTAAQETPEQVKEEKKEPDETKAETPEEENLKAEPEEESQNQQEEPVDEDQAARAAMVSSILKSEGRDGTSIYDDDTDDIDEEDPDEGRRAKKSEKGSIARTVGEAIKEEFRKRKKSHGKEDEEVDEDGVAEYYDDEDDEDDFDDFDFDDEDFDEDDAFDSNKN